MDVFTAEKLLIRLLQQGYHETLLHLAVERRLDAVLKQIVLTPEIVQLMKQAGWIDNNDSSPPDYVLRSTIGAYISGIAGFFIYWGIPITAEWVVCDHNPEFVRELITNYPPERWVEQLVTSARARGVPPHLINGMLTYAMFDAMMPLQ